MSGLPIWDPLVQTTIEFEIGPAGCTDPNAGNYIPSAVVDDNSIDNAELDFDSEVINTEVITPFISPPMLFS